MAQKTHPASQPWRQRGDAEISEEVRSNGIGAGIASMPCRMRWLVRLCFFPMAKTNSGPRPAAAIARYSMPESQYPEGSLKARLRGEGKHLLYKIGRCRVTVSAYGNPALFARDENQFAELDGSMRGPTGQGETTCASLRARNRKRSSRSWPARARFCHPLLRRPRRRLISPGRRSVSRPQRNGRQRNFRADRNSRHR